MLARAPLAVVDVADDDPPQPVLPVAPRDLGDAAPPAGGRVRRGPALAGVGVDGARQQVGAEAIQVPAPAKPGARRRDLVGRGRAAGLDKYREVGEIPTVPARPRG